MIFEVHQYLLTHPISIDENAFLNTLSEIY